MAMLLVAALVTGSADHLTSKAASPFVRGGEGSTAAPQVHPGGTDGGQVARDGIDVDEVARTVSHRVVPDAAGALVTGDDRYRATFDADGFEVGPTGGRDVGVLRVSTSRVLRGSTPVETTVGPWRADANVAERSLGSGMVERVTATDGEVEWDVVLAAPPLGAGDLRIDADVSGPVAAPTGGAGVVRWDVGDGRSMVMGELVVRDRHGAELHRAMPAADRHGVSLQVPAAVLREADFPVIVDPVIGPEHAVADPVPGMAADGGSWPVVGFDGTNHFVAWSGDRSGDDDGEVFGTRVSRDGVVLDPVGIPILMGPGSPVHLTLAFDGDAYLLAYALHNGVDNDVHGVRLRPDGVVLGDPFPIATGPGDQYEPSLSFGTTSFLLAWQDSRNFSDVVGARISPDGVVLDDPAIAIAAGPGPQETPVVTFDGTNHVVGWVDLRSPEAGGGDIYAARVDPAGAVLDPDRIPVSTGPTHQFGPMAAGDGGDTLFVWNGSVGDGTYGVFGARLSDAGAVLDPGGIAIAPDAGGESSPTVAFDGTNYLVAWTDRLPDRTTDIVGARVSAAGVVLDGDGIAIAAGPGYESEPVVAFGDTDFLVLWSGLQGARVTPAGVVRDPSGMPISTAANEQTGPAVASDGTNHLVVWTEDRPRDGNRDIYAARVAPDGTILDGTGIAIAIGGDDEGVDEEAADGQTRPAVAFGGGNYLVTWTDEGFQGENAVVATRVTTEGVVLDPLGIRVTASDFYNAYESTVASDGSDFLVVWADRRNGYPNDNDVFAARVRADGEVLDPDGIAVATADADQDFAAVAFDGTNYLAVWTDWRSDPEGPSDIFGARVTPAGVVLDPAGIAVSTASGDQHQPAVASDGTRHLVVWTDGRDGDAGTDIFGARVGRDGVVREARGIPVSAAPGNQSEPSIAARGRFVAVWRDERSGDPDIYGAWVTGAGRVVHRRGLAMATTPVPETGPVVVDGPGRRFGLVYQRFAVERPYGSNRVFLRTLAPE